jgi:adenylate cyclase
MGAKLEPRAFAGLVNRFYGAATESLIRHDAIIDKLMGDEVMALFIPGIAGPQYRRRAADAACDLMRAVGYATGAEPWMPIGAAVHAGTAFVGNVGGEGVVDFTALGDTVNCAARLAATAAAGEVLFSEDAFGSAADALPDLEQRSVTLRGKDEPMTVRVLRLSLMRERPARSAG